MFTLINNLPDNVLGVSAEGKVTGMDYKSILIPEVEKKFKSHKKLRMLYHIGEAFSDFDMEAMSDDAKLGMKHLFGWEKIALVSDLHIINTFASFFGYLVPCDVRVFSNASMEEAKKWISED